MRVEQLGSGEPDLAIVGGIHGDEPCGVEAIERLLADEPAVDRPIKLLVANERALAVGQRYVDVDLNRAFGADADETDHEVGLARRLADELRGTTVLSLHSTQSHPEPFGLVAELVPPPTALFPYLSIAAVVEVPGEEGRMFAIDADLMEVEAGRQGSEQAAENAYRIAREFLTATGALPGETVGRELPVYRLLDRLEKPPAKTYEVLVDNFELIDHGEVYARADDQELAAEEPFYPILLSAYGYADQFGYTGQLVGTLAVPEQGGPRL